MDKINIKGQLCTVDDLRQADEENGEPSDYMEYMECIYQHIEKLEKENHFMFNEIKRYLKIDLGWSDEEATKEIKKALENNS